MMLDSWLLSPSSWSKLPSDVHIQPKGFVHVLQHEVIVTLVLLLLFVLIPLPLS